MQIAAGFKTQLILYRLNAHCAEVGKHPEEIRHPLCEIYGDPFDELYHRLIIEVACALSPIAMSRGFTLKYLRWLYQSCRRQKARQDRRLATSLAG